MGGKGAKKGKIEALAPDFDFRRWVFHTFLLECHVMRVWYHLCMTLAAC